MTARRAAAVYPFFHRHYQTKRAADYRIQKLAKAQRASDVPIVVTLERSDRITWPDDPIEVTRFPDGE